MKIYQVTIALLLNDDAKTDWIERVIEDNLEPNEEILEGNIVEEPVISIDASKCVSKAGDEDSFSNLD